ncbi:MAG: nicotinic acid mononucleotide adenylyltransferase [Bacteroidetes bacterium GWF2_43_63]|nr:MAG: nicotinic acid mononucleotide adenylyltransferase [Bacteroidetes bacterium GWE2_42_42]OFY53143.1 MAG: nicotinic acid mononucleotide adenylyltransferase [Bacteroidetes bacterium GWF2_43_63]HBG70343.1 nicotinic acid mononucleotide adenylyltransferase [Bacteroidales bacterium]HCB60610.1 nicotinic acid mononucleotide adenylyltransferase [Bacteroidales bacterium]HCY22979.1 nicotinic acid mononucleotide adenylyltransferase [Bacteroidales bacterium]
MNSKKQIGLYFGSFNPPHIGHMAIANYLLAFGNIDEIWFVVSPQNPLKEKQSLIQGRTRLEMVRRAIGNCPGMRVSDVEFGLPTPNYTINTLVNLEEKFPDHAFCLIMGMDNIQTFHKWKSWETILEQNRILVYPRPGFDGKPHIGHPHVEVINAPLMEISSSFIRDAISEGRNMRFFLPEAVAMMIENEGLYKS